MSNTDETAAPPARSDAVDADPSKAAPTPSRRDLSIALSVLLVVAAVVYYAFEALLSPIWSAPSAEAHREIDWAEIYACPAGATAPHDVAYMRTTTTLNEKPTKYSLYVKSADGEYPSIIQSEAVWRRCVLDRWIDVEPVDTDRIGNIHGWVEAATVSPVPTPAPDYYYDGVRDRTSDGVDYTVESGATVADYVRMKPLFEPAVGMIRARGWRCDTISGGRRWATKRGFTLKCNGYAYSYDFEDRGGSWVVSLSD